MKLVWVASTKAYFGLGWQASLPEGRRESEPELLCKARQGSCKDYNLCMLKADLMGGPEFGGN